MMTGEIEDEDDGVKRIIVVGLHRGRLYKIMSLVENADDANEDYNDKIQFVFCLASMSFYDDEDGNIRRYMSNFVFHDGSSMTQFLDDEIFRSSLTAVLLVGYEWKVGDTDHITRYFETNNLPVSVKLVSPNADFQSLREEMEYFKNLNDEKKTEYISNETMGPGKMARFIRDTASTILKSFFVIDEDSLQNKKLAEDFSSHEQQDEQKEEGEIEDRRQQHQVLKIDPDQPRFACRICRSLLFGSDHLAEDHIQNVHTFKRSHPSNSNNGRQCQSLFCDEDVLNWLSTEANDGDVEGRLKCPKCSIKLGHWNWSGAQCSCGTWVVPAIQIPLSKVDTILPRSETTTTTTTSAYVSPTFIS